jgi:hypothetical protein
VQVYSIRREDRDRDRGRPTAVLAAQAKLQTIATRLEDAPYAHVCLFRHFELTPTIAYTIRPLVHTSLHERVTLRPFLAASEKLWIVYQLLVAVDVVRPSSPLQAWHKTISGPSIYCPGYRAVVRYMKLAIAVFPVRLCMTLPPPHGVTSRAAAHHLVSTLPIMMCDI